MYHFQFNIHVFTKGFPFFLLSFKEIIINHVMCHDMQGHTLGNVFLFFVIVLLVMEKKTKM